MASRNLRDLHPSVAARFTAWVKACRDRDVEVLVYCTYRSLEEQAELYARGRTAPGKIVTNAPPGSSWHNYRRAIDAVPVLAGKPDWSYDPDERHWKVMVEEADRLGIEWAGRWRTFREYVHFQITDGLTLEQAAKETP